MSTDFKQKIAEVKTAYDIVEHIESAGVSLTRAGTNKWKGLCPFHTEKTPSFLVDENFQNYRCFGCGANGDIIKFIEHTEHLDFIDVLKKLAEDKNIELNFDETGGSSGVDYRSLRELLRDTANFYVNNFNRLPENHAAKQEITKRGLSLNKTHYGYALEDRRSLYNFLRGKGYTDDLILEAGVGSQFDQGIVDFWNGRLMFIITDIRGRPIGFSGRKLYEGDSRGKYVNSKDNAVFDKSNSLYGLNVAREPSAKNKRIYVTEGQFDVASFVEAGIRNVVASSGTAFTEKQALICRRIVGEDGEIVFAFDGDEAGRKAALKTFYTTPLIHSQSFVLSFPEGVDPSDYREKYGNEKFREFLKTAVPMVQYVLEETSKEYDLDTDLGRDNFIKKASDILIQIPSQALKEVYMRRVALMAFVPLDVIRNSLRGKNKPQEVVEKKYDTETVEHPIIEKIETDAIYDLYARLLRLSVTNPILTKKLSKLVKFFPSDFKRLAYEVSNAEPPFVPERFHDSELLKYLILQEDWFPLAYLMSEEEIDSHFNFIYNKIVELRTHRREDFVRRRISAGLGTTSRDDSRTLSYALKREKAEIQKRKERELQEINNSDIIV